MASALRLTSSMPAILSWSSICANPALRDLPFKVELTERGILEMSPARPRHGEYQFRIGVLLDRLLPDGRVIVECPVEVASGEVRVPDVAWIRLGRERYNATSTSLTVAPDVWVEVLSWSNTPAELEHKRLVCAALGGSEFWTCSEAGEMIFLAAATGEQLETSSVCPAFPRQIALR